MFDIEKNIKNNDNISIEFFINNELTKENINTDEFIFENNFLVQFPQELYIRLYDSTSIKFLNKNKCRFTIRNNSSTLPLINLENYKNKQRRLFRKKDKIVIYQLDKNLNELYSITLQNIKIENFTEKGFSYYSDKPQEIVVDITFKHKFFTKCKNT